MKNNKKTIILILAVLFVVSFWTIIFSYFDVRLFVEKIGVGNGYLIAVLVAFFGGLSAFTTASFFSTIGILSIGGLSPWVLALVTSPVLLLGDYIFYFLGESGKKALSEKIVGKIERFYLRIQKHGSVMIPVSLYIYAAFTPLPADVLMISLAILGYPFKKIFIPTLLGHFTLIVWLGYLAIATGPSLGL